MARSILASCLLASIACGPSLKQAQRSIERYEQCYGADYDPSVVPDLRRRCWASWLEQRTESDPPERVRYAEMRLQQLSTDRTTRPLPIESGAPPPTYRHEYPRSPPAGYPTTGCTPLCNDQWAECNSHCLMKDKHCLMACEAAYRICIEGCP